MCVDDNVDVLLMMANNGNNNNKEETFEIFMLMHAVRTSQHRILDAR